MNYLYNNPFIYPLTMVFLSLFITWCLAGTRDASLKTKIMTCIYKFVVLSVVAVCGWSGYRIYEILKVPPLPELPQDKWWGPCESSSQIDTSIRPFQIKFEPERIDNLKRRLKEADFYTEPLEGISFEYGFNAKYLQEVVNFWGTEYDFASREQYLNQFTQFKTNIQGLDIHYLHVMPKAAKNVKVYPLLLLHGWPGSIVEFYKIIPRLITPRHGVDFVFEVVAPSLPGYGYSQAASKPGLGAAQMAVIMRNLMQRLGYDKYICQGGDWGAIITSIMAILYHDNILGYHTNMAFDQSPMGTLKMLLGTIYPSMIVEKEFEKRMYPITPVFENLLLETGYLHIQATKPDTIGLGLRDSPVGLAAYILEKFSTWTNPNWKKTFNGGLTKKITLTELLDNVMVYWHSRSITTSMRLYAETFNKAHQELKLENIPVKVPTAIARFEHEITFTSSWQLQGKYLNIVQLSDFSNGGHFPAFEVPKTLADDIWNATSKFIEFHEKQLPKTEKVAEVGQDL